MSTNGQSKSRLNGWRTDAMYSFREAAHLSGVSSGTVRNWLLGYVSQSGQEVPPLLPTRSDQGPMVSFLQLIEIVVAARFRMAERTKYEVVRTAHQNAKAYYHLDYPFAYLNLRAVGGHIISLMHGGPQSSYQAIDDLPQRTLPGLVEEVVEQLEYYEEYAAKWYPVGKDVPIVVDPLYSSGVPTIKGRGVTIHLIHRRFKYGKQRIEYIASDLELDRDLVEKALQYAEQVAA